ncbi:MAG TPA: hypothetical protein VKH14_11165 [Candidatus Udaeobacter sp.]|nr:hypothetical protein [Candidatus Udaeobacter sp.]
MNSKVLRRMPSSPHPSDARETRMVPMVPKFSGVSAAGYSYLITAYPG